MEYPLLLADLLLREESAILQLILAEGSHSTRESASALTFKSIEPTC